MNPFSWPLRKSMVIAVLLATLPALSIIVVTGLESKRNAELAAYGKITDFVRSLAVLQVNLANEAQAMLNALARTPTVKNMNATACSALFSELHKGHYNFTNLLLATTSGNVIASGIPEMLGVDISDRPYFKETLARKTFCISGYILSRGVDESVQVFTYPVLDDSGTIIGVLAFAFTLKKYGEFIHPRDVPEGMRVTLLDTDGIRMFQTPGSPLSPLGKAYNPKLWPIMHDSPEDEGNFRGVGQSGVKTLFAFKRLRLSPESKPYMIITVSISDTVVFKEANWLLLRNTLLTLAAIGLALFITKYISNGAVLRGLDGLMSATRRLAGGDLATRADPSQGAAELRQLAATFNDMALVLQARQSELRQSADTINKMRSMLNNILESMPSAVIGVNREDVITHWNNGATKLCGVPQDQALGKRLADVFPWLAEQVPHPGSAARGAPPVILQKCSYTVDDDTRFMDILTYPLMANGIEGAVVRVDDVTSRVHLETMMVQREKMSTAGSLAAGMAHDINNPLAGILQSVQNIMRRISPGLQANIRVAQESGCDMENIITYLEKRDIPVFLAAIKDSGERAGSIVRNMLGFIRRESSDHVRVQLEELLDHALELAASDYDLKREYDFRKIEIVREYSPGLPTLLCSPSEIEQVFYNLATNAAQAMIAPPKPGRPSRLILRTYLDGDRLVAEVEDNGPGMSEALCKKVFDPLFTTKAPGEGTGLGLAVAYFIIVNTYHGELLVDSVEGRGAKFIIRLPAGPQDPVSA